MDTSGQDVGQSSSNAREPRRTRTRSRSDVSSTHLRDVDSAFSSGHGRPPRPVVRFPREAEDTTHTRSRQLATQSPSSPGQQSASASEHHTLPNNRNTASIASNSMGPGHSAIQVNTREESERAIPQSQVASTAMTQFFHSSRDGASVTFVTGGPSREPHLRLDGLSSTDTVSERNNSTTTLGRRVLAAAAASTSQAPPRVLRDLRSAATRQRAPNGQTRDGVASGERGTASRNGAASENAVQAALRQAQINFQRRSGIPDDPTALDRLNAWAERTGVRIGRSSIGRFYSIAPEAEESTPSYNVRRRLDANGDEYVHHIPAEGWMDPEFPNNFATWTRNAEQRRQASRINSSSNRRNRSVEQVRFPVRDEDTEEARAFFRAIDPPPPRQNNANRWRRERREALNLDEEEIIDRDSDVDADRETVNRARGRLDFLAPAVRRTLLEAENGRQADAVSSEDNEYLPRAVREQLANDTPYYLSPLPRPVTRSQKLEGGERKTAVPASRFSELAAR